MVEIRRLTAEDVKDKSLAYLLARASHELECGPGAYPVCMASLLGQRLRNDLCPEGDPRALPKDVEAVWRAALERALPGSGPGALEAMTRDMLALADYDPKAANPARVEEMLLFIAALRDGLEGRLPKDAGQPARADGRAA